MAARRRRSRDSWEGRRREQDLDRGPKVRPQGAHRMSRCRPDEARHGDLAAHELQPTSRVAHRLAIALDIDELVRDFEAHPLLPSIGERIDHDQRADVMPLDLQAGVERGVRPRAQAHDDEARIAAPPEEVHRGRRVGHGPVRIHHVLGAGVHDAVAQALQVEAQAGETARRQLASDRHVDAVGPCVLLRARVRNHHDGVAGAVACAAEHAEEAPAVIDPARLFNDRKGAALRGLPGKRGRRGSGPGALRARGRLGRIPLDPTGDDLERRVGNLGELRLGHHPVPAGRLDLVVRDAQLGQPPRRRRIVRLVVAVYEQRAAPHPPGQLGEIHLLQLLEGLGRRDEPRAFQLARHRPRRPRCGHRDRLQFAHMGPPGNDGIPRDDQVDLVHGRRHRRQRRAEPHPDEANRSPPARGPGVPHRGRDVRLPPRKAVRIEAGPRGVTRAVVVEAHRRHAMTREGIGEMPQRAVAGGILVAEGRADDRDAIPRDRVSRLVIPPEQAAVHCAEIPRGPRYSVLRQPLSPGRSRMHDTCRR
jgi:hypothetical protein